MFIVLAINGFDDDPKMKTLQVQAYHIIFESHNLQLNRIIFSCCNLHGSLNNKNLSGISLV